MNSITPNCKCVIVRSVMGNNGIEVTALRCLNAMPVVNGKIVWFLDKNIMGSNGKRSYVVPEFNLRRLDDYDLSTDGKIVTTWGETGFVPDKLRVR